MNRRENAALHPPKAEELPTPACACKKGRYAASILFSAFPSGSAQTPHMAGEKPEPETPLVQPELSLSLAASKMHSTTRTARYRKGSLLNEPPGRAPPDPWPQPFLEILEIPRQAPERPDRQNPAVRSSAHLEGKLE